MLDFRSVWIDVLAGARHPPVRRAAAFLSVITLIGTANSIALAQGNDRTPLAGQRLPTSQRARTAQFETVSIRENSSPHDWSVGVSGDEYRAMGLPLAATILAAYFPRALQGRGRVLGAPGWIWSQTYDFIGKVEPADLAAWEMAGQNSNAVIPNQLLQNMLQQALKERCGLVVHSVPSSADGYVLVLKKGGPNWRSLHASDPHETVPVNTLRISGGGWIQPYTGGGDPAIRFYGASMESLAAELSLLWGIPVIDRTGVSGRYDFAVRALDREESLPFAWDWGNLGLKMESRKIPAHAIVVDHIEKPSPN